MNNIEVFNKWIEKQRVAYHKHNGWQNHPVAVKDHQKYFTQCPAGKPIVKPTSVPAILHHEKRTPAAKPAVPQAAPAAAEKEPWQMTRKNCEDS